MQETPESNSSLPALSLRELRLLASRLGLGRYAALTRDSLMRAIRGRIERQAPAAATPTVAPVPTVIEAIPEPPSPSTWVAFTPQDDRWAEVRWSISDADMERARAAGATSLCLRLGDVTGLTDGDALPHALQEVVVESGVSQWYLPIPLAGRSYRVELGYRTAEAGGWIGLAVSAGADVPASPMEPAAEPLPEPFLFTTAAAGQAPVFHSSAAEGPHERLYQVASSGWRRLSQGSEAFMERAEGADSAAAANLHDSGAGLWASGRQESGAGGVAARKRRFWLVADAELIVHAATEPSALLTIGDAPHPLSEEGTLRIQVPFPDGDQDYPIAALAADGEQSRHITLSFQRRTPEARVNRREEAVDTWF